MLICYRPDCNNPLNSGRKYCSNRCAAIDRKRATLERQERPSIPLGLASAVESAVGAQNANIVLAEVDKYLKEELIAIPIPLTGQTYGDLVLNYDGTQDYRPSTQISFDVIEKMLRSGPVVFAMEMKRAQVYRVFSQGRYKVISPDKELAEVAEAALRLILPKMAQDFTWSAFAYGASFQEEVWEWKTKYQLGMVNTPVGGKTPLTQDKLPAASSKPGTGDKPFLVPKVPNSVNPQTVDHIRRTPDGGFNGFAQKRKLVGNNVFAAIDPIIVEREQSLVIPLNERFRNLWGESILKAIYIDWLWYEIIFRTMVRYMERMATPTTLAKAPSRATVTISGSSTPVKAMDLGLALAGSLSKSNAVAIPSDRDDNGNPLWDIGYLTAEERAQPFLQVLEYLAQAMIRDALSADRSITQSSGGVGSYNIGEVHAAASAVTSEMILLQFLHYLNMYFMPEFSLYNRGVDGPPIWLRTQAIDTQERDLLMALIGVAGNSPAAMELFYLVDWRTLAETSNIPTLTEDQLTELKDKLNTEAEEKMKTQQEIMSKNAAPIPTGGASAFKSGSGKTAPRAPSGASTNGNSGSTKAEGDETPEEGDRDNIALENIFEHHIPWMLGEYEANILYEHGVIGDETIKLFNPFHEGKTGRFAKGRGGGAGAIGGGGSPDQAGVVAGINAKQDVLAKAIAKKGFPFKTTGAILGLTGLGLVGVAVVQANSGEKSFDEYRKENLEKKAGEAEQLQAELAELTANWPKDLTPEQAMGLAIDNLRQVGVEGIPADIKVDVGSTPMGMGAYYDPNTNTFTMNPAIAAELASGDPVAMAALFHEVSHANQELQGQENFGVGLDEFPEPAPANGDNYRALIEGQNDLVAHIAMSNQYGQPMSNETAVDQHKQAQGIQSKLNSLETGVTITGGGGLEVNKYGYQEHAEVYAALAVEGAKKTGQTPKEYLISNHNDGFNLQKQHQNLVDVFPDEMRSSGYYAEREETEGGIFGIGGTSRRVIERRFPSTSEVRQWMQQHGYVDPKKAYDQMLQEAAGG